jgi:hypothetical protein
MEEDRVYRPRWWCRLHLFHRMREYRSDDGGYYKECRDCGKYRELSGADLRNLGGGAGQGPGSV